MVAKQETDAELIEASLSGNRESFGKIVERYQNLVCSIAYSATGDLELSEDLAQETFITAWRSLKNLRDRLKFRSWLIGIVRNLVKSHRRKDRRNLISAAVPMEDHGALAVSEQIGPREEAVSNEQQTILWNALEDIPENYREPLILYYRERQSVSQVAEALELSEEAVKSRLHRGRAMLKEEVNRFVEGALCKTQPGKVFTVAVMAALPALAHQATFASVVGGSAVKGSGAAKVALAGGLSGAVLGPILGALGALYGTMASILNTRSVRERRFMIWVFCIVLALVGGFGFGLHKIVRYIEENHPTTETNTWLIGGFSVVYIGALMALIIWATRRQRHIQIEDGTYVNPWRQTAQSQAARLSLASISASCGGSIIGGMLWMLILTWFLKDWLIFGITLAFTTGLCAQSIYRSVRAPHRYFPILIQTIVIMTLYTLVVFNLQWEQWLEAMQRQGLDHSFIGFGKYPGRWGFNAIIAAVYVCVWQRLVWVYGREDKSKHETSNAY